MVRLSSWIGAIALAALAVSPAVGRAGTIGFTGNVERDFPLVTGNGVRHIIDNPKVGAGGALYSDPRDVRPADYMLAEGKESGWNIKDVRLHYDAARDTLAVGINFFGVGGDIDGNGDPNTTDPRYAALRGYDDPRMGGWKTVAMGFDFDGDKTHDIVAGIPLIKPAGMDGIASFRVAKYADQDSGLAFGFGATTQGGKDLMSYLGAKSIETSAAAPDIEFELVKFSELARLFAPKFQPDVSSLGVELFAAKLFDTISGEEQVPYQALSPQNIVPEPTTLVAWSAVLAGGLAWRVRRRGSKV